LNRQNKNDNAANRKSYVGEIYNTGEKQTKAAVLDSLKPEWAKLHREGYLYIHDLDAYGLTYNCLTFDILKAFPYTRFAGCSDIEKILLTFDFIKELLAKMGNEQSGGMSFANFDNDFATIFSNMNIDYKDHEEIFAASIRALILWCNNIHTRMGQTSYYVTFNIGLANNKFARFLAFTLLDEFYKSGSHVYKPNIVFKVKKGISRNKEDANYDLLEKALLCTAQKMIPTYLLCDCESDKNIAPEELSIMGCRTRVADDLFGKEGAVGRSNIVGKPIASMLLDKNATVTIAHSRTENLEELTRKSDIIIIAIGKPHFINEFHVSDNTIIIDVGINRMENGKLLGDSNPEQISKYRKNISYTPVPGGVGPLTVAMLMEQTYLAYLNQNKG